MMDGRKGKELIQRSKDLVSGMDVDEKAARRSSEYSEHKPRERCELLRQIRRIEHVVHAIFVQRVL